MSIPAVRCLAVISLIFVSSWSGAFAAEGNELNETIKLLSSRPIMETLQAHQISSEERTTVYIYQDRIEYYDESLLAEIQGAKKLPATSEDGVLFTESFLTQFKGDNALYVVLRGWHRDGNCRVLTIKLDPALPEEELPGPGNACSGDPCNKCKPYNSTTGCSCEAGHGTWCNHIVTSLK